MNKTLLAALLAATSFTASADVVLGGDVEINAWSQTHHSAGTEVGGKDYNYAVEASFEHFVPLVPNFKVGQSAVDSDAYAYTKRDFTAYYEFFDNDILSFDAGIGVTQLANGELKGVSLEEFKGYIPHLYVGAEVGIPTTPVFLFAKGNGIAYNDHNMLDASIGLQYEIGLYAVDLELQAGYRVHQMTLEGFDGLTSDLDIKTDGVFVGINVDF